MDNEFRIAEILKGKGMTQTDLAKELGTDRHFSCGAIKSDQRKYNYSGSPKNCRRS